MVLWKWVFLIKKCLLKSKLMQMEIYLLQTIEHMTVDLDTQKKLSQKYPEFVEKFLTSKQSNLTDYHGDIMADYRKFLNNQDYDKKAEKLFIALWKALKIYDIKQQTKNYTMEYKKTAMEQYTKSIFKMMDNVMWLENIKPRWNQNDALKINSDGTMKMSFSYKEMPFEIKIDADGNILATNYLVEKNKWKNDIDLKVSLQKINHFFSIVSLKELMTPNNKLSLKDFVNSKDIASTMKKNVSSQIEDKLMENYKLWNQNLMKAEVTFELQKQYFAYKILSIYKPPVDHKFKEWINWQKAYKDENNDVLKFMKVYNNTFNNKTNAPSMWNQFFSNEKISYILENLPKGLSTYKFFEQTHLVWNEQFNMKKMKKFLNTISSINQKDKVLNTSTLESLPHPENYKWRIEWWKLKLEKDKSEESVLSKLETVKENVG